MDATLLPPNPGLIEGLVPQLLAEEAAARAARASGRPRGPMTGLPVLDGELGGFLSPGLHVMLAAPGVGKTALALQIAGECGCPALFVTAEMRPVELLRRIAARTSGTYLGRLRGGELSDNRLLEIMNGAAAACPQLAIFDATAQETLPVAILEAAEGLKARFQAEHVLIVLDSLTDWAGAFAGKGGTEYEANESALNALKEIAFRLVCPVLTIVHRNRASQTAGADKQLHSGKATGRIEYIAQSVWSLDRDGTKEPNAAGITDAKLTLLKNRDGITGRVLQFSFEGRLQKFTEA